MIGGSISKVSELTLSQPCIHGSSHSHQMLAFRPYGLQLLGYLHRPPRVLLGGLCSNARLTPCRDPLNPQARNFSFSVGSNTPPVSSQPQAPVIYNGPLTATFRRLKVFSLASFGLSVTLAPFMFLVESNLPLSARFALASIATGTSGLSTFLVAWCAKPYVTSLGRIISEDKAEVLEMTTMTLTLRPLITRVRLFYAVCRYTLLQQYDRFMTHASLLKRNDLWRSGSWRILSWCRQTNRNQRHNLFLV